jgi:hypothetical protein
MSTKFILTRDINGYNGFGLLPCEDIKTVTLAAGVAASLVVPDNFDNWIAIFGIEPGVRVWVAITAAGTSAAVPGGGTFGASSSELNPIGRQVKAGDTISCITADMTADVSVALYALGNNS